MWSDIIKRHENELNAAVTMASIEAFTMSQSMPPIVVILHQDGRIDSYNRTVNSYTFDEAEGKSRLIASFNGESNAAEDMDAEQLREYAEQQAGQIIFRTLDELRLDGE